MTMATVLGPAWFPGHGGHGRMPGQIPAALAASKQGVAGDNRPLLFTGTIMDNLSSRTLRGNIRGSHRTLWKDRD